MKLTSILAIYLLFWTMSFFLVLPFGVRTSEEVGEKGAPGHAESAPHSFSFGRTALRATLLGALLFALYYANWTFGWIGVGDVDWLH